MLYLKAFVVGVAAAVGSSCLLVAGFFSIPLLLSALGRATTYFSGGSAGIGAVSVGMNEAAFVLIAVVAFVAGFVWTIRRDSVRRRAG